MIVGGVNTVKNDLVGIYLRQSLGKSLKRENKEKKTDTSLPQQVNYGRQSFISNLKNILILLNKPILSLDTARRCVNSSIKMFLLTML